MEKQTWNIKWISSLEYKMNIISCINIMIWHICVCILINRHIWSSSLKNISNKNMNIDILIYKQKRFGGLRQIINQEVYTQYKSRENSSCILFNHLHTYWQQYTGGRWEDISYKVIYKRKMKWHPFNHEHSGSNS